MFGVLLNSQIHRDHYHHHHHHQLDMLRQGSGCSSHAVPVCICNLTYTTEFLLRCDQIQIPLYNNVLHHPKAHGKFQLRKAIKLVCHARADMFYGEL